MFPLAAIEVCYVCFPLYPRAMFADCGGIMFLVLFRWFVVPRRLCVWMDVPNMTATEGVRSGVGCCKTLRISEMLAQTEQNAYSLVTRIASLLIQTVRTSTFVHFCLFVHDWRPGTTTHPNHTCSNTQPHTQRVGAIV